MAIHNVEITKLYKNDITQREQKKRKKGIRVYSLLLLLLVPVFAMVCLRLYSGTNINDLYMNVCNLYNPIYSPYSETGSITFAWNYTFDNSIEDFELPIISSDISIDKEGTVTAKVKESILVKSVADGVVDKIKSVDGVKVVRILYAEDLAVEYYNIDVLGVQQGNMVERGKEIGTAKLGESIQLRAYIGEKQVKGISIKNNKIVWQS